VEGYELCDVFLPHERNRFVHEMLQTFDSHQIRGVCLAHSVEQFNLAVSLSM